MANKNWVLRIIPILLVLCLISSVMLSGTFAKYTSEYSGQDTALVARWNIIAAAGYDMDGDILMDGSGTKTLPLFDHEYNAHINQKDGDDFIIAPGVSGQFFLAVASVSDVDADVEITIEQLEGSASVPIEYNVVDILYDENGEFDGYEEGTWVTLDELPGELVDKILSRENEYVSEGSDSGKFRIASVAADSSDLNLILEGILWRWPYEASKEVYEGSTDATDTALGLASAEGDNRISYGIEITVKATQVAPEKPEEP